MANFIAEFTYAKTTEVVRKTNLVEAVKVIEMERSETLVDTLEKSDLGSKQWTLFVYRASNESRFKARIMLISSKEHKIHCTLHFGFQVSNNEAEEKALFV